MMENNRNDQSNQQQNSGMGNNERGAGEKNPQDGSQWDNYQTRSLSSEGGEKLDQDDLMNADEAGKQKPQHRE